MTETTAARTLVKSPPELWEACSDPASLTRHLSDFGEITITRLEPETTVAWEGERASGTVRIEPAGWGTKVILTARLRGEEATAGEIEALTIGPPPAAELTSRTDHPSRRGRLGRLLDRLWGSRGAPAPGQPEPDPAPVPAAAGTEALEPADTASELDDAIDADAVLDAALDSLGRAHHRPFSRG